MTVELVSNLKTSKMLWFWNEVRVFNKGQRHNFYTTSERSESENNLGGKNDRFLICHFSERILKTQKNERFFEIGGKPLAWRNGNLIYPSQACLLLGKKEELWTEKSLIPVGDERANTCYSIERISLVVPGGHFTFQWKKRRAALWHDTKAAFWTDSSWIMEENIDFPIFMTTISQVHVNSSMIFRKPKFFDFLWLVRNLDRLWIGYLNFRENKLISDA